MKRVIRARRRSGSVGAPISSKRSNPTWASLSSNTSKYFVRSPSMRVSARVAISTSPPPSAKCPRYRCRAMSPPVPDAKTSASTWRSGRAHRTRGGSPCTPRAPPARPSRRDAGRRSARRERSRRPRRPSRERCNWRRSGRGARGASPGARRAFSSSKRASAAPRPQGRTARRAARGRRGQSRAR